jgi:addiction module HigA family antidote
MKNPVHPGVLVKANLEELGVSVADAAAALGVTRQQLYNVIGGKSAVTPHPQRLRQVPPNSPSPKRQDARGSSYA